VGRGWVGGHGEGAAKLALETTSSSKDSTWRNCWERKILYADFYDKFVTREKYHRRVRFLLKKTIHFFIQNPIVVLITSLSQSFS
jgi:hypothetical protein